MNPSTFYCLAIGAGVFVVMVGVIVLIIATISNNAALLAEERDIAIKCGLAAERERDELRALLVKGREATEAMRTEKPTDEALVKAMFDAYWNVMDKQGGNSDVLHIAIRAALAVARPIIEREAREKAWEDFRFIHGIPKGPSA